MRLRLIVVGRDKNDPICQAADAYMGRVERTLSTEIVEVREVPLRKSSSPEEVMALESERILRALGSRDRVVALDRRGASMTSRGLAAQIDQGMQGGLSAMSFVIGGPSGLHRNVLDRAHQSWSLSELTFPHRIARLLVSEQLYRACSILRGEPYHK